MQIVLTGYGSCSALGSSAREVALSYAHPHSRAQSRRLGHNNLSVFPLSNDAPIEEIVNSNRRFSALDRVTLMAMHASSVALNQSGWNSPDVALVVGSARGQTSKIEDAHAQFLKTPNKLSALTSPTTTAGGIASCVANYLKLGGTHLSVSATCVSAIQAIALAVALIKSGAATKIIAGGSEAALTSFTIAQMLALGIYSQDTELPCRPCIEEPHKQNRFVLGEGAAMFALQTEDSCGADQHRLAKISGIGFASEPIDSLTSISENGAALYRAMSTALGSRSPECVDAVILHAPGTIAGDQAELNAISRLFGSKLPLLTSNKWLIGHTLGASGALSLEMAVLLLNGMLPPEFPYPTRFINSQPQIKSVLINSAGFGGQAGSILLER